MLKVMLDIFSGVENPSWHLTSQEEQILLDHIKSSPNLMQSLNIETGHLGYRGFIVYYVKDDDGPWSKMVHQELRYANMFRVGGLHARNARDLEKWILRTSDKPDSGVNIELRELLAQSLDDVTRPGDSDTKPSQSIMGSGGVCCASTYLSGVDVSYWNGVGIVTQNNCYNFAANYATLTEAQPGRKSRYRIKLPVTGVDIASAIQSDGWRTSCQPRNNLNVALAIMPPSAINPLGDFHFYRLVSTSPYTWGHKPGNGMARIVDGSGKAISNPETCDRRMFFPGGGYAGTYSEFCGYWFQDNSITVVL